MAAPRWNGYLAAGHLRPAHGDRFGYPRRELSLAVELERAITALFDRFGYFDETLGFDGTPNEELVIRLAAPQTERAQRFLAQFED